MATKEEELLEEKKAKKEEAKAAAALASKEHYARMKRAGYKKFGIFFKADKIRQLKIIADTKEVTLYELLDVILNEYLENFKKPKK
jgi:hypothetical protein